jgi:signal transduction histidine kinase
VLREGAIVGLANHTVLISKDGREIPVDDSAAPIRTSDGPIIGVVMVFRDVIERRRVERERLALLESERTARTEAEAAVRARDEFLSIASHELRNPVNAVQLQLAGVLREVDRGGDAVTRDWLADRIGHAHTQVNRLTRLIDNLLDVSRITAGALVLELEDDVDFREVVRSAADHFGDELKQGQAILRLPQEPVLGRWDRVRLDQVVTNLLSNAIKYGNGKPIELSLRTEGDAVHFSIADQGIGIEPDKQRRLFGRFERAVSGRQYGGFGLGLWITERIVQAMRGTITVDSQPGKGSTFSVVLPRSAGSSEKVLA